MKAIDKPTPGTTSGAATEYVQAWSQYHVRCEIMIKLPDYPNHYLRPPRYNVLLEKALLGSGAFIPQVLLKIKLELDGDYFPMLLLVLLLRLELKDLNVKNVRLVRKLLLLDVLLEHRIMITNIPSTHFIVFIYP